MTAYLVGVLISALITAIFLTICVLKAGRLSVMDLIGFTAVSLMSWAGVMVVIVVSLLMGLFALSDKFEKITVWQRGN